MAKCEKRQIVQIPPPVEYVLTLSEDEAVRVLALVDYLGDIHGGNITSALIDAGVPTSHKMLNAHPLSVVKL